MRKRIITEQTIAAFQRHLAQEEKHPSTIQKYCRDTAAFIAGLGGAEVTKEAVIAFKQRLVEQGYAARSINSMLASLNSLFSFLGWQDLKVKTIRIQRQIFCPVAKELTKTEYKRLCRAARESDNERLDLILQTICATGIRVSELSFITVEAARQGEATVRCKGKSRPVFLVRKLQKKLLRYAKKQSVETGALFLTRNGKPIDRTNIWREMKALCARAHVEPSKVFPHNLRHLFARLFYKEDRDIVQLADILGHSSINTTRIYTISTGAEHRNHMENLRLVQ